MSDSSRSFEVATRAHRMSRWRMALFAAMARIEASEEAWDVPIARTIVFTEPVSLVSRRASKSTA